MSIGILFESPEWSNMALCDYLREEGIDVFLIDLEQEHDLDFKKILSHKLIVNRVFPSAQFRNHSRTLNCVKNVLDKIKENKQPMINPYEAYFYETSKQLATMTLKRFGIPVPDIYDAFYNKDLPSFRNIKYPCILKPDSGGRTTFTYLINSEEELKKILNSIEANIKFIVQRYIKPVKGFITRVEVIGGECYSILQRTVTETGLSAYHLGSKYLHYYDCSEEIKKVALDALFTLKIDVGSLDIIEGSDGFYIIDVNATSNFAPENIEEFGFNLIKDMAVYIARRYNEI